MSGTTPGPAESTGATQRGRKPGADAFARSRAHREALGVAMAALDRVVSSRSFDRVQEWARDALEQVAEVEQALVAHIEEAEGPHGLLGEVRRVAPRLARRVSQLEREHQILGRRIADLELRLQALLGGRQDVSPCLDRALALLRDLSRHRQRGADLVYEAFSVDLGGSE
jgi:hypothetical protein